MLSGSAIASGPISGGDGPSSRTAIVAVSLAALLATSAAQLPISATGARTLGPLTTVSAAKLPDTGRFGGSLAALTSNAAGPLPIQAAAGSTLSNVTLLAASQAPASAHVSAQLGGVTAAASGVHSVRAQAAITLQGLTGHAATGSENDAQLGGALAPIATQITASIPIGARFSGVLQNVSAYIEGVLSGGAVILTNTGAHRFVASAKLRAFAAVVRQRRFY